MRQRTGRLYWSALAASFLLSWSTAALADEGEDALFELWQMHNAARIGQGLPPLRLNVRLNLAAQRYAEQLQKRGELSHTLDGRTPHERIQATGYLPRATAENIAQGQPTPERVMQAWMDSPSHRRNVLNRRHEEIGLGRSGAFWVVEFGDRQ